MVEYLLSSTECFNMHQRLLAYITSRHSDRFWFIGSRVLRFICSPQNPLYSNSSSICTHKHYAATPQRFLTKQIFMNLQTAFCQKRKLKKKKVWLTEAALLQFTSRSNKAVITSELWKQEKNTKRHLELVVVVRLLRRAEFDTCANYNLMALL